MENDVVLLSEAKVELLKEYQARIQRVFGIIVTWEEDGAVVQHESESGSGSGKKAGRISFLPNPNGPSDSVERAKAYVHSLLLDDTDKCVSWERYQPDSFRRLTARLHDAVERQSQAVLSVLQSERVLCVWGPAERVAVARALMDQALNETAPNCNVDLRTELPLVDVDAGSRAAITHTLSPGAESNHDSCYDSDESLDSRRNSSTQRLDTDWHSAVDRTASDTLAAEHVDQDDATRRQHRTLDRRMSSGGRSAEKTSTPLLSEKEYESKLQFSLKLGYTEPQLQSALSTLGPHVSQDTLLNELIQLTTDDDNDDDEYDDDVDKSLTLPICAPTEQDSLLRPIVIDGSNVAMSHGDKDVFSCRGIQIAVEWFQQRGHEEITVFVPQWRKENPRPDAPILDQDILTHLEREKILVFTPARRIGGKRVICYDDRYVLKLASVNGGVVVSNDHYRDLMSENAEYKKLVEERLLMYSFVNDRFMPPDDPLGRRGPSLDNFLRREALPSEDTPPLCPYQKKCTYGNKCKYFHPERGLQPQKPISDRMAEQAKQKIIIRERKKLAQSMSSGIAERQRTNGAKAKLTKTRSLAPGNKTPLGRTHSFQPASDLIPKDLLAPTRNSEVVVSVTDDEERTKIYNDKLSVYRRRAELAVEHDQQYDTVGQLHSSRSQGTLEIASHDNDKEGSSLKPPKHWANPHVSLRAIHSDPSSAFQYNRGGHLALAKKLSDESAARDKTPSPPGQNSHRKLHRQLSLKGPDDDRLLMYGHPNAQVEARTGHCSADSASRHVPVTRMGSAPAMARDSISPTATCRGHAPPSMKRQNSTSDPQLNLGMLDEPSVCSGPPVCRPPAFANPVMLPYGPGRMRIAFGPSYAVLGGRPSPLHQQALLNSAGPTVTSPHAGIYASISEQNQESREGRIQQAYAQQQQQQQQHSFNVPQHAPLQMSASGSSISQTDPRYSTYFHLCHLFPEDKVLYVMHQHPYETNPQTLCSMLLSLS